MFVHIRTKYVVVKPIHFILHSESKSHNTFNVVGVTIFQAGQSWLGEFVIGILEMFTVHLGSFHVL